MGYGTRKRRSKTPTVRSNHAYIRKVDLRDRPPLKSYKESVSAEVVLNFKDTLLLQKTINSAPPLGIGPVYKGSPFAQVKAISNTDRNGVVLANSSNTSLKTDQVEFRADNLVDEDNAGMLECYRPLLYENASYLNAMCAVTTGIRGTRKSRQIPTCLVSGSFKITMVEGDNVATDWTSNVRIHAGSAVQYGTHGFNTVQYVRVLLVKVTDMGTGLDTGPGDIDEVLQNAIPLSNYRKSTTTTTPGTTGGVPTLGTVQNLCDKHLLAPSLGDLFDNVQIDPHGDYAAITSVLEKPRSMYNPDMATWKYRSNDPADGVPITDPFSAGSETNPEMWDPLRGTKRTRKFHVLKDQVIAFKASGSQSTKVNQLGAKHHYMKYSYMIKNQLCQMETGNLIYDNDSYRTRENLKDRYIWYFIPSISPYIDGYHSTGVGSGHHAFYVTRGEEKVTWTEKDDY